MTIARGLVALSLIPLVGFLHFLLATQFEIYERRPIWGMVVILASLIVLARLLIRTDKNKKALFILNLLAWALALILIWWVEVYTQYPPLKTNYTLGQKINLSIDEGLEDGDGNPVNPETLIKNSQYTLLTFYRGHW